MNRRVLLVDDEPNILDGYRRVLRKEFDLRVAPGPQEALRSIEEDGPFAVVVSDLQMPEMDGIELLTRIRDLAPDTVRMILTGQADLDVSIAAVNRGQVFRFLTKPCSPQDLARSLRAAIEQHRLIMAEQELLEGTLRSAVEVLIEVLGLADPAGHDRAVRLRAYVGRMAAALRVGDRWELELAAMVSQLGTLTLPGEIRERLRRGIEIEEADRGVFALHPQAAFNLLSRIPRLERVAVMVRDQLAPPEGRPETVDSTEDEDVAALGAHMLFVAGEYDRLIEAGWLRTRVMEHLRRNATGPVAERLVRAIELSPGPKVTWAREKVALEDLSTTMMLEEDVVSASGLLLVRGERRVTPALLEQLRAFQAGAGVAEPLVVKVPQFQDE